MASLDYRLNPLITIKECSSCGSLYNKGYCCTSDSSQQPPQDCVKCGNLVECLSCQECALWRKKLKEVWFTICHENGIYQDLLNTYESSDDDTNVVNAPQEPFVVKQDPGENSSQSPPQINHNCCYECGDSLDGIFCQRCTCKSCGKGAHIGYNCPPKAPIISNPEPCNQTIDELPQTLPSFDPTCYSEKENSLPYVSKPNFVDDSPNVFNPRPQPPAYSYEFCGNDAYYGYDCPPQVPFIYPEPCYNHDFNFPQNCQSRSRVLGLNKWYQSLLRDFDLRSITFQTSQSQTEMDPYVTSTPNSTKLPILDTGKFEQWKFRIQQYLQHEHYALWEVIEFGDSYRAPAQDKSVSGEATPSSRSKGRTVAVTTKDMQKRRNDVKARTTLLLALPDEHQLRFSKYETTKELWEAILRTFGGNEATKKTKKNLLKQQYGNFKAEGSETLEQTFNRLQTIVSQLEFLNVPVEQEDLNQKFLTSLSPEWLMHTIVWRNRNDLDTMSLDDLYNHLKVYESEVQKKL
ncbi:hypothetical protein Tco_0586725 [Tanacetum coccineum]